MTEYGRIHTDGSRSGGQPVQSEDNFQKLALNGSFERVAKVAEEREAFNEAMDNLIAQDADLLDAEGAKLYWYRQGKDDGVEHERAKIVAWLREQQTSTEKLRDEMNRHTASWHFADEHASSLEQSANAIEAGEHLK